MVTRDRARYVAMVTEVTIICYNNIATISVYLRSGHSSGGPGSTEWESKIGGTFAAELTNFETILDCVAVTPN